MSLHRLINPVMPYAWGSTDAIPALQGRPATGDPEAELWIGAHPNAPSLLEDGRRPLGELIGESPRDVLGSPVVDRFGPRLPFMLKVIAAAQPLSLQVHPDDDEARQGYARESAAGLDVNDPRRCYRDPNAKPEMVLALSDFDALLGFRSPDDAATLLAQLRLPLISPILNGLRGGGSTGDAFVQLVSTPVEHHAVIVDAVRTAASSIPDISWATELADRYPFDPGVAGALLLNRLRLRPGQVCYVAPGVIHAYLRGTAIEALGASDNVVRAGLTPKYVDVDELRDLLHKDSAAPWLIAPTKISDVEEVWPTPRPELRLSCIHIVGRYVAHLVDSPRLLLCVEGDIQIRGAGQEVSVRAGEAVFVSAVSGELTFVGEGVIVAAATDLAMQHRGGQE